MQFITIQKFFIKIELVDYRSSTFNYNFKLRHFFCLYIFFRKVKCLTKVFIRMRLFQINLLDYLI